MTHNRLNYLEQLHAHGYRATPQRVAVLDALCRAGGHVPARKVLALVQATDSPIDRATVYRALDTLVRAGLALTAPGENGQETLYEIVHETPHHHLRCVKCGAESELDAEAAARVFSELETETGYRLTGDHLVLSGLCPACQTKSA